MTLLQNIFYIFMSKHPTIPNISLPRGFSPKIGIARARFHNEITELSTQGAEEYLKNMNIVYEVVSVAGSFELPYVLQQMALSKKFDALVAIGCLIKGETMHFELIAKSVTQAIMQLTLKHTIPIGFGVITAMNERQARARINLGVEATHAAIDCLLSTAILKS